jgi:hypothetical protein
MATSVGKNLIPDFSNCVRDRNGDIWCYDKAEKCVYRLEKPSRNNVPKDILYDLLEEANEKGK